MYCFSVFWMIQFTQSFLGATSCCVFDAWIGLRIWNHFTFPKSSKNSIEFPYTLLPEFPEVYILHKCSSIIRTIDNNTIVSWYTLFKFHQLSHSSPFPVPESNTGFHFAFSCLGLDFLLLIQSGCVFLGKINVQAFLLSY